MPTILEILVSLVILFVGGVLFVAGLPLNNEFGDRPTHKTILGFIIGGAAVFILGIGVFIGSFGWTEIGPGQVGVVINLGKVDPTEISSGLNWRTPIISTIHVMDTRVQSFQFGGDPNGDQNKADNQGIETFTAEQQPAYIYGNVNYSIDPTYAAELFLTVGDDWFNKVVVNPALAELKQDARLYTVDRITSARDELAHGALERLQKDVNAYHITINGIFVNNIRLSSDYVQAVLQKQVAQQKVEQAKSEAETARQQAQGQADAIVLRAKGDAEATVLNAQGQAEANAKISASLTEPLIRWQTIQKLAGDIKVWLVPQNSNNLFNLGNPAASNTP